MSTFIANEKKLSPPPLTPARLLPPRLPLPQFFAGVIFVIALSLVVWLNRPSNVPRAVDYIALEATFPSIDGIHLNGHVRMLGVKIGHVANIEFADVNHQSVTVTIHITYPDMLMGSLLIPEDSSIRIVTPSIFADKELLIEPGSSFDSLTDGDSFILTQSSFMLDDLLRYIMQHSPTTTKSP